MRHLAKLGFMKVCNLNQDLHEWASRAEGQQVWRELRITSLAAEDFYKVIQEDRIPQHHIFMTNPPYSSDHVPRCLEQLASSFSLGCWMQCLLFCLTPGLAFVHTNLRFCRKSMKPCLLLLPNWVAKKPYFFEMYAGNTINVNVIQSDHQENDMGAVDIMKLCGCAGCVGIEFSSEIKYQHSRFQQRMEDIFFIAPVQSCSEVCH